MSTYVTPSGALQLSIPANVIYTTGTNIPLPITFGSGNIPDQFWDSTSGVYNDDGSDIVICDTTGNVWPQETLFFDRTNKRFSSWVKVPIVTSGVAIDFLLQWGNGITINDPSSDVFTNCFGGYNFRTALTFCDPQVDVLYADLPTYANPNPLNIKDSAYHDSRQLDDANLYYYQSSYWSTWRTVVAAREPAAVDTPLGTGLDLAGNDGYQIYPAIPDSANYSFVGDGAFSILSWINLYSSANSNYVYLMRKFNEYSFQLNDKKLELMIGADNGGPTSPIIVVKDITNQIALGTWVSVGCSYDGSQSTDGMALYASGLQVNNWAADPGAYAGMSNTTSPLDIGLGIQSTPYNTCPWGTFDGIYLINKKLSAQDFQTYSSVVDSSGTVINVSGIVTPVALSTQRPAILTHPASVSKNVGDYHTFTVTASGEGTISYQWRKDGEPIVGETGDNYFLSYITADDAGDYDVIVSNFAGSTISNTATLTIYGSADGVVRYGGSIYSISGVLSSSLVEADDINVPVPVFLNSTNIDSSFWDHIYRVDGKDVVLTSLAGVPFEREIVSFNKTAKDLQMWAKFPVISGSTDIPFLIQYGSTALNYPNTKSVWKTNYNESIDHKLVLHLENNGLDSVENNNAIGRINHQSFTPEEPTPMLYSDGELGHAWYQNEWPPTPYMYGSVTDSDTLSFVSGVIDKPISIRVWMWARGEEPDVNGYSAFDWTDLPIISKGHNADQGEYVFTTLGDHLGFYTVDANESDGANWAIQGVMANGEISGTGWGCLGATYNPTVTGYAIYLNGDAQASSSISNTYGSGTYTSMKNGSLNLELGRNVYATWYTTSHSTAWGTWNSNYNVVSYAWDTKWSEIFILNGTLSANQMKTQYQLEANYDTSVTWGTENTFDTNPYVPPTASGVPTITSGPVDVTAEIGDTVYFQVVANGTAPLYYLWKYNGTPIPGATNYLYVLTNAQLTDVGFYECTVYNDFGVAYAGANLSVVTDDGDIIQPSGVTPPASGIVPSGVITLPSGAFYSDAGDYRFIDKSYEGYRASDAPALYSYNIGNMFYSDIKEDRILFGNTSGEQKHYYLFVGGLNSTIYDNLELSVDRSTWDQIIDFNIDDEELKLIYLRYTVENNPNLGYGTLQLKVAEV